MTTSSHGTPGQIMCVSQMALVQYSVRAVCFVQAVKDGILRAWYMMALVLRAACLAPQPALVPSRLQFSNFPYYPSRMYSVYLLDIQYVGTYGTYLIRLLHLLLQTPDRGFPQPDGLTAQNPIPTRSRCLDSVLHRSAISIIIYLGHHSYTKYLTCLSTYCSRRA